MNLIRLLTLRSLRTRPLRTILSTFGIVLGVACLLAIRVTNLTALDSIVALFEDTSGKSDLVILPAETGGEGIPVYMFDRLRDQPGLDLAVPSIQVQTAIEDQAVTGDISFSLFGSGLGGLSIYGIDPDLDPGVRTYALAEGTFLENGLKASEILLVKEFAADNDLQIGNQVALLTPTGPQKLRLVGLLEKEGPGQINNGAFGVVPIETLQSIFNRQNYLDQIDLLVSGGNLAAADLDRIKDDLQARLGGEFRVTYPASQGRRVGQMLDGYQIGLNFLSGMALFVGAFLIYNAFSMTVIERTREFGFMRTIGVTRRQIIFLVIFEAGLLGIIGSLLGAGFGILMAQGLTGLLATLLEQEALILTLPTEVLVSSVLVGLVVTLVAAAIPAFQAGRTSPLAALRVRGTQREGWLMRYGWTIGGLLLLFSTYILILNPFPYDVQFRLGSVTVFALFVGGTLIIPVSVGIWERLVRPAVRLLYGNSGRIGSGNIQRSRLRTTLTVAALMVGVAMIMVTRGMTDSFRSDLEIWIDAYIGGDLFVNSTVPMGSRVERHLESVAGVEAVAPVRYFEVAWKRADQEREPLTFMAFDPAAHARVTSFIFSDSGQDPQQALDRLAAGDAVFVSSVLSEKYGLVAGDTMQLKTRSGFQPFTIAAVVVDFYNQGLVVQGNWNDMRRYFRLNDANLYLVKVSEGASVPAVQDRIEAAYGKRDNLTVVSNQSIIDRALQLLRQSYSLFDALALIAMLVAGMGVVNTLTMNVMERTREIGMLRSIGMTRRQIVQMILAESGIMGLVGGGFGLAFGIVLTRIFLWSMTAMSGYKLDFIIPVTAVAAGFLIALLVSQFAAVFPARRAVRTRILEAIQYE